jgi:hypothetical protein
MALQTRQRKTQIGRHVTAELDTVQSYLHRFLSQQVSKIFQSCPDIVGRDVHIPAGFLKVIPPSRLPTTNCNGESRTADYWPAPADGRDQG